MVKSICKIYLERGTNMNKRVEELLQSNLCMNGVSGEVQYEDTYPDTYDDIYRDTYRDSFEDYR